MENEKIEPVVIGKYSKGDSPVVVKTPVKRKSEDDSPVILKKKKTNVRQINFEPYKMPDVSKMKLKNMASSFISFFKSKGYLMNEGRAKAFIASMLSCRLLFLNRNDEDKLDILFEYFGAMPNVIDTVGLKKFNASDALKAIYSARYNPDGITIVAVKATESKDLDKFREHVINPYDYSSIDVNCVINDRKHKHLAIPENVWIFVLTDDDHKFDVRKYGTYAKLSLTPCEVEECEHKIPSYNSFKEAFIDVKELDDLTWKKVDEIVGLIEAAGYKFDNRSLNMIDDYLVSLNEMGMDTDQAIDFLIINKILYMSGDEMVKALAKYSGIGSLKHTAKKLERMV
ncbi:MAG: hypothetical protein K6A63_03845 [Acholeplasmatales bacterium]|nr:hypothetical protein [Acholeplasmatales bacterium]